MVNCALPCSCVSLKAQSDTCLRKKQVWLDIGYRRDADVMSDCARLWR
jgi:hypothetical protein